MFKEFRQKLGALTRAGWSVVGLMLCAVVAFGYWADPSTAVGRINWLANGSAIWFQLTDPGTDNSLRFRNYTGTDAVVITTNNYVGIGTTAPASAFDNQGGATRLYNRTSTQLASLVGSAGDLVFRTDSTVGVCVSTGGATAGSWVYVSTQNATTACD